VKPLILPEKITRAQVMAACEALGLDPHHTFEIHLFTEHAYVKSYITDEDGSHLASKDSLGAQSRDDLIEIVD
jgi:hypothetical protein